MELRRGGRHSPVFAGILLAFGHLALRKSLKQRRQDAKEVAKRIRLPSRGRQGATKQESHQRLRALGATAGSSSSGRRVPASHCWASQQWHPASRPR
jgi:hypothetical protein